MNRRKTARHIERAIMADLVGKLSPRAMGWDKARLATAVKEITDSDRILLGRIAGIVAGLKETVDKETGDISTGLKGNFRGISSLKDVGVVTSGVCYLPGGIQEMLEGTFAKAREEDAKATVQFVVDLFAIRATNKAGYTFVAENIVEAEGSDPLSLLIDQAAGVKALPAPGKAPKVEVKPEETKEPENA